MVLWVQSVLYAVQTSWEYELEPELRIKGSVTSSTEHRRLPLLEIRKVAFRIGKGKVFNLLLTLILLVHSAYIIFVPVIVDSGFGVIQWFDWSCMATYILGIGMGILAHGPKKYFTDSLHVLDFISTVAGVVFFAVQLKLFYESCILFRLFLQLLRGSYTIMRTRSLLADLLTAEILSVSAVVKSLVLLFAFGSTMATIARYWFRNADLTTLLWPSETEAGEFRDWKTLILIIISGVYGLGWDDFFNGCWNQSKDSSGERISVVIFVIVLVVGGHFVFRALISTIVLTNLHAIHVLRAEKKAACTHFEFCLVSRVAIVKPCFVQLPGTRKSQSERGWSDSFISG